MSLLKSQEIRAEPVLTKIKNVTFYSFRDSDVVLASPYQTAGNCPAFPLSVLAHLFMRPSSLKRGDIVVVRDPWDPKTALCKRVIGESFIF